MKFSGNVLDWTVYVFTVSIAALLLLLATAAITANGAQKYCYVEAVVLGHQLQLKGSVDWKPDDTIGYFDSVEEAVKAAGRLGCPLRYE